MNKRRAVFVTMFLIAAAIVIGSIYYYFYGKEYTYRFTEAQLQQALSERLPVKEYFAIFSIITLDHPRVTLVNGSDRIRIGLDISLDVFWGDRMLKFSGSVDSAGGVRYNRETGQLFLTQPKIERLELQGIPEQYTSSAAAALSKALDKYYSENAIYTLDGFDAKQVVARLTLKSVVVESQQLAVTVTTSAWSPCLSIECVKSSGSDRR